MIRTLIIDDEAHNRETMSKLLQRYCPGTSVVGMASGVVSGIKAIRELHPDLVLLDLNMADGTGFDLLRALVPVDFRIIFVSAMDRSTIKAFRLSNMEFLLKPVSPEELREAITRSEKILPGEMGLMLKALESNIRV
jgi:two-component system LytT family response regulator